MARGAGSEISGEAARRAVVFGGGVVGSARGYLGTGREKFSKTRDSLGGLISRGLLAAEEEGEVAPGEIGGLTGAGSGRSSAMAVPQLGRSSDEKSRK